MPKLNKCKYCGTVPIVADVGGNNPYYEVGCTCDKGVVISVPRKEDAISCWNILNERNA